MRQVREPFDGLSVPTLTQLASAFAVVVVLPAPFGSGNIQPEPQTGPSPGRARRVSTSIGSKLARVGAITLAVCWVGVVATGLLVRTLRTHTPAGVLWVELVIALVAAYLLIGWALSRHHHR
jgi:hypothetical protein